MKYGRIPPEIPKIRSEHVESVRYVECMDIINLNKYTGLEQFDSVKQVVNFTNFQKQVNVRQTSEFCFVHIEVLHRRHELRNWYSLTTRFFRSTKLAT